LGNVTAGEDGTITAVVFSELLSLNPEYPGYPGGRSIVLVAQPYYCTSTPAPTTIPAPSSTSNATVTPSPSTSSLTILAQGVLGWAEGSNPIFPSRSQTPATTDTQLICHFAPIDSDFASFSGDVYFQIKPNTSDVYVLFDFSNLEPNSTYSLHVHQYGDISDSLGFAVGNHFDVGNHTHGCPSTPVHHLGDLGNVMTDTKGSLTSIIVISNISLIASDDTSVVARAVVLDNGVDNCADDPNDYNRIAQCVIGFSQFDSFSLPGANGLSSATSLPFSFLCLLVSICFSLIML